MLQRYPLLSTKMHYYTANEQWINNVMPNVTMSKPFKRWPSSSWRRDIILIRICSSYTILLLAIAFKALNRETETVCFRCLTVKKMSSHAGYGLLFSSLRCALSCDITYASIIRRFRNAFSIAKSRFQNRYPHHIINSLSSRTKMPQLTDSYTIRDFYCKNKLHFYYFLIQ